MTWSLPAAATLFLVLPGVCQAENCTAADTSRAAAPNLDYFGTPVAFMSCNTPEVFYGAGMSGMPYTLEQIGSKTADGAGVMVQLKLTPQDGGAVAFRGFVIKAAVGSFECLSTNTRFKNCSGVTMQSDAPGGEGTHQSITQVVRVLPVTVVVPPGGGAAIFGSCCRPWIQPLLIDVAQDNTDKSEATFTWRVPTGTTGVHRLTVVVLEVSDWYGASVAFSFDEVVSAPKLSTSAAAAAGEITLGTDIATFQAETFEKEMASVLGIPVDDNQLIAFCLSFSPLRRFCTSPICLGARY